MIRFLLFVTLFISITFPINANSFADYKTHIAPDRLLVIFKEGVSAERKAELLQNTGLVSNFTHLPNPHITICNTTNRQQAEAQLVALPEVQFVSFFITDGKYSAGVLDHFFIKLRDKNMEPLMQGKLEQLHLGTAVADKYIANLYSLNNTKQSGLNTVELCALLQAEGWCLYASPDYLHNPLVCSNDTYYNRQWAISNTGTALQGNGHPDADMDVDSAWLVTTGDATIKIGIIDSGVDTLQEDLMANILPGHDAVSDSTDGYPTPAYPEDGHGTCCAGIAAAVQNNNKGISGIAPSCKIIPVRSFYYILLSGASDPLPYSTAAAFADAIGWAWSDGQADILSNSWGLPPSLISILPGGTQPVTDAINTAYQNARGGKGIAMFFSSGNDNDAGGSIWPGSMDATIAVNATSMCDERKNPADCSGENWGGDYGKALDFSAPGVKIVTTDMMGNKGFSANNYSFTFNGTSAACPNAAGVGALVLSLRPELGPEDIRAILAQTAEKVGGYAYDSLYANGTWSQELGYGRLNARRAVDFAFYYSGINEQETALAVQLYPNPANQSATIVLQETNAVLNLYDLQGRLLAQQQLQKGSNSISIATLATGLYVARVSNGKAGSTIKLSVAH
ncbi:MAG: S8 family peptidase [Chitinophagales bacterium]